MSKAQRWRLVLQWDRYVKHVIPETGGWLNTAMPLGYMKASNRAVGMKWTDADARVWRKARRSR